MVAHPASLEKIVGPTWTEYDGEWTVEPFTPPNPTPWHFTTPLSPFTR